MPLQKYSQQEKERLIADPRFRLLGRWESCENKPHDIEISEHGHRFFIFFATKDEAGFNEKSEMYPLHYDRENDVFHFFREGRRTELLPDPDGDFLTIYPRDTYRREDDSFEDYSMHLTD